MHKIISFFLIFFCVEFLFSREHIFLPLIKNEKNNKKICYIFSGLTGEKLSYFGCEDIGKQSKDLIAVKQNGKWGYVNYLGDWEILPQFDFADSFYNDLARVEKNDKYMFINKKGEIIIDIRYLYVGNFYFSELAPVQCEENKNYYYGYINKKGNLIIPCMYQIAYEFYNNIARVRQWDLYGYIVYDSKKLKYRLLQNFMYRLAGDFTQSITYVLKDDKFVYINPEGEIKKKLEKNIIPDNFSLTDPFGKFQDLNNGWYGYWDLNFDVILPPIFLEGENFYLSYAKVKGPKFYIDKKSIKDHKEILNAYRENNIEEFYIDTSGRRITFWD